MKLNDIAESMYTALNSKEHKSLFSDLYKIAQLRHQNIESRCNEILQRIAALKQYSSNFNALDGLVDYLNKNKIGAQVDPQLVLQYKQILEDNFHDIDPKVVNTGESLLNELKSFADYLKSEKSHSAQNSWETVKDVPANLGEFSADVNTPKHQYTSSKYGQSTKDVQEKLKNLGPRYANLLGAVDGDWGDKTEAAFQAWKKDNRPGSSNEEAADELMKSMAFQSVSALDVAFNSLLTASAALDSLGLDRGSHLTLKIASLVVEAKKADKKKKEDDKKKKSDSKSKSDSQSAKDKRSKDDKSLSVKKKVSKSATDILSYKVAQIAPNTYRDWPAKSLADNAKSGNINLDDLHRSNKITNEQYDQAYVLLNGTVAPGADKQPKKITYGPAPTEAEKPNENSSLNIVAPVKMDGQAERAQENATNVDKVINGKKYHVGPDGKWTLIPTAQNKPITEIYGYNVKRIQDALALKGIPIGRWGADGRWGHDTQNALNDFKKRLNIPGVTDKQALLWLMSGSMPAQNPPTAAPGKVPGALTQEFGNLLSGINSVYKNINNVSTPQLAQQARQTYNQLKPAFDAALKSNMKQINNGGMAEQVNQHQEMLDHIDKKLKEMGI